MKLICGDMFKASPSSDAILFVTTNAVVRFNGALVMGAGAAKTLRDSVPGIDHVLGKEVRAVENRGTYGIAWRGRFGAFQVKYHYKDRADLNLIAFSTRCLSILASAYPEREIILNYPGIGNGGLQERDVQPIIERLPDNVSVYKME